MAYVFPLKRDVVLPQSDGSYLVYLKSDFQIGYYVDRFDPVGREAVLGLALYRDGKEVVRLGNPMHVSDTPVFGPIANQAEIESVMQQRESLQQQINSAQATLSSLETKRMQLLEGDPNADTSTIDSEIGTIQSSISNMQSQFDALVIPDPVYEWTLDFATLVTMAPNLELTPEFIQFALQIKTSLGLRIGDIVDTSSLQTMAP